jgi:membrane protein YdbS with pleckstrin-like domain
MNEAVATVEPAFDADTVAGEHYALHPAVRTLWRIQTAIFAALVVLPGTIPTVLVLGWYGPLLSLLVAVAILVLGARYHRAYLANFRCVLLPDGLLIRRGVLWQSETFVPRPRIQHTDVDQGPIARRFGIAKLKVFTAGTQEGQLEVDGLRREDAIALRDKLLGRDGHDAV